MTRLELANQLIEGQPAFHFAFIPTSNFRSQISDLKIQIVKFQISNLRLNDCCEIFDLRSEILVVPAEGFEPTLSSF